MKTKDLLAKEDQLTQIVDNEITWPLRRLTWAWRTMLNERKEKQIRRDSKNINWSSNWLSKPNWQWRARSVESAWVKRTKVPTHLFHHANVQVPWAIFILSVSENGLIRNEARRKERMFVPTAGRHLSVNYAKSGFLVKSTQMVLSWMRPWNWQKSNFRNLENQLRF